MGNIYPDYIKKNAREIFKLYKDDVSIDFELNKELVSDITDISSKGIRNKIAAYLVTLKKNENRIITSPRTGQKISRKSRKKKSQRRRFSGTKNPVQ